MSEFKPGDEVQYEGVPDDFMPWRKRADPDRWPFDSDAVYVVADVVLVNGEVGLVIRGIKSDHPTGAWHHIGWRKVQRRDLSAWLETAATDTDRWDKPIKAPAPLHPVPSVDALFRRIMAGGDR